MTIFTSGLEGDEPMDELQAEFLKDWKKHQITYDPNQKIDDGDIVLWYELDNGKRIPIAARSELLVITGKEKSRKSLLSQCFAMANAGVDRIKSLGFRMDLQGDIILQFDTEQPKRRARLNRTRYHTIAGLASDDESFKSFNIKKMSFRRKLEFIPHVIQKVQDDTGKNIGMLIIDQIADLMPGRDVNDSASASQIVDDMDLWDTLMGQRALIVPLIHTNRGGLNTNGVLGSLLDKKCDVQYLTEFDLDTQATRVIHKESRDVRMPNFTFRQDYDGAPRLMKIDPWAYEDVI